MNKHPEHGIKMEDQYYDIYGPTKAIQMECKGIQLRKYVVPQLSVR